MSVVQISDHLPIEPDAFEVGQRVKVSFIGGPFVPGTISQIVLDGPILLEDDGTKTVIPIEDIEDRATLVYAVAEKEGQ